MRNIDIISQASFQHNCSRKSMSIKLPTKTKMPPKEERNVTSGKGNGTRVGFGTPADDYYHELVGLNVYGKDGERKERKLVREEVVNHLELNGFTYGKDFKSFSSEEGRQKVASGLRLNKKIGEINSTSNNVPVAQITDSSSSSSSLSSTSESKTQYYFDATDLSKTFVKPSYDKSLLNISKKLAEQTNEYEKIDGYILEQCVEEITSSAQSEFLLKQSDGQYKNIGLEEGKKLLTNFFEYAGKALLERQMFDSQNYEDYLLSNISENLSLPAGDSLYQPGAVKKELDRRSEATNNGKRKSEMEPYNQPSAIRQQLNKNAMSWEEKIKELKASDKFAAV